MRGYQTAVLLCADICSRYGWGPQAKKMRQSHLPQYTTIHEKSALYNLY